MPSVALGQRNLTRVPPFVDIARMSSRQNYRICCDRKPFEQRILQHSQQSDTALSTVSARRVRFSEPQPCKREPWRMRVQQASRLPISHSCLSNHEKSRARPRLAFFMRASLASLRYSASAVSANWPLFVLWPARLRLQENLFR